MIAMTEPRYANTQTTTDHASFLAMLPAIRRAAQITFRKVRPELRDELIEEVVANCFVAYAQLVERGQADVRRRRRWPASPLPKFAPAAVSGTGCGFVTCSRITPSSTTAFKSSGSIRSTRKRSAGKRSSWTTRGQRGGRRWLSRHSAAAPPGDVRIGKVALTRAAGETTKGAAERFGFPRRGFLNFVKG